MTSYICDPDKNYICTKTGCHEDCWLTTKKEFALITDVCIKNDKKAKMEEFDNLISYAKGFYRGLEWNNSTITNSKPSTN